MFDTCKKSVDILTITLIHYTSPVWSVLQPTLCECSNIANVRCMSHLQAFFPPFANDTFNSPAESETQAQDSFATVEATSILVMSLHTQVIALNWAKSLLASFCCLKIGALKVSNSPQNGTKACGDFFSESQIWAIEIYRPRSVQPILVAEVPSQPPQAMHEMTPFPQYLPPSCSRF